MHADYLITGAGICGTLLSHSLVQAGKTVMVIDSGHTDTASYAASGVINPVTGKRLAATWKADTLLPFAKQAYDTLGDELGLPLIQEYNLLHLHTTADAASLFSQRQESSDYLYDAREAAIAPFFHAPFGAGTISPCYLIAIQLLLDAWRQKLIATEMFRQEVFNWDECRIAPDGVAYKDITAGKIICCEGAAAQHNPYWKQLPFSLNKGEALVVRIPGLPRDCLYKHELSIIPFGADTFWVGSSYEWKYENIMPTTSFRDKAQQVLQRWLKLPFEIVGQVAAERPATVGQMPFAGLHPLYPAIGILNGTGSKGCSLAPWLAAMLAVNLTENEPLLPDISVQRFKRLLSRNTV